MRSGTLRHRLQLQSRTITRNSYGEDIESWATYATVWGRIANMRGSETTEASSPTARKRVSVRIRYRDDISVDNKILFGDKEYEINTIDNYLEQNIFIDLSCTEIIYGNS